MSRFLVLALWLSLLVSGALASAARAASPTPEAEGDADSHPAVKAKNIGEVDGIVSAVDYQKNRFTLITGKTKVDVVVLPSTNIQGKNGFNAVSDIVKGQHLTVFLSQHGDEKDAQMIQLQK